MGKYITLQWTDDIHAERRMTVLGIRWERKTIRLSQIDFRASHENQARMRTPIIRSAIEDYKSSMKAGDGFPSPVVYKSPNGYVISSGNQRTGAVSELAKDGDLPSDPELFVYVALTQERILLDTLTRTANNEHGQPVGREERIEQALYSVNTLGTTVRDAALQYNVGESALKDRLRADKERKSLQSMGVDMSRTPNSVLVEMARVRDRDMKEKIGRLASQHNPTAERMRQVTQSVAKAGSRQEQLGAIKQFEEELADEERRNIAGRRGPKQPLNGRRGIRKPRRDKIISLMSALANFLETGASGEPFTDIHSLQADNSEDMKALRGLWFRIHGKMTTILGKN